MSKQGKIAVWTSVAVVLTILLVVVLSTWGRGPFGFRIGGFSINGLASRYSNHENAIMTMQHTASNEVHSIELNFSDENIVIMPSPDNTLKIEQLSNADIPENRIMQVSENNGKLVASGGNNNFFFFNSFVPITINVYIPKDSNLDIYVGNISGNIEDKTVGNYVDAEYSSVSGNITLDILSVPKADFSTTSGNIKAAIANCDSVELNTVSGNLNFTGAATEKVRTNSTSGDARIELTNMPVKIDSNTISGSTKITIPENNGFVIDFESVSGDLSNDFPTAHDTYKNADSKISVNSVSGDLDIIKA